MADYWKSNPRHYCKYCDCWIADNKPSKDFHERGKKHQEMVKKKLDEVKKKARENEKAEQDMDSMMKRIERKAMASFQKDLKTNPLLQQAALEKKRRLEAEEASKAPAIQGCAPPPADFKPEPEPKPQPGKWKILFSDEGYPYFWNQDTNEVQWTKPDDYVPEHENRFGQPDEASTQETEDTQTTTETETQDSNDKSNKQDAKEQNPPDPLPTCDIPLPTHEIPLPPPPGTEATPAPAPEPEPEPTTEPEKVDRKRAMPSSQAYGGWEQMPEPTQEGQVDLQLPEVEKTETQVIVSNVKEAKIKFRTKTVNPIAEGLAAFKKRKVTQGARNMKKREDDR